MTEPLQVNELFDGRYRLLEKKNQGTFGEVWRACDEHINAEVALKVYSSFDEKLKEEFKEEYKLTFKLNHPNLLRTLYIGHYKDRSYLVMPYCPSSSTSLVGCCNEEMFWRFVHDVALGLEYLHKHDIIHHDIKPDNILIGEDGTFLIADFGISQNIRNKLQSNASSKDASDEQNYLGGTVAYMGPELFVDHPYCAKTTDIWALGVTMYEMLTGHLPFFGQGGGMLNMGAEMPELSLDFVSKDVIDLIHDCLIREPWNRPTAAEIAKYAKAKIDGLIDDGSWSMLRKPQESVESHDELVLAKTIEPQGKKGKKWLVAAAVATIVVALTLWIFRNPNDVKQNDLVDKPEDTVSNKEPQVVTASFLEVNGSSTPKIVHDYHGGDTLLTVSTDGGNYTINNVDNLPKWLSLNAVTDTSFVLHLNQNTSEKQRSKVIELTSGEVKIKVSVIQKPNFEKVKESKLVEDKSGLVEDGSSNNNDLLIY